MTRHCLRLVAALLLLASAFGPAPAAAQGFNSIAYNTTTGNVTLTTTTETVIVSSGPATTRRAMANVCILAWAQLTTGTGTTAVTAQIKRGTATSGTLVGEANAETVKAAAGSTEPFFVMACEDRNGIASAEYSLTLTQTGASANGTALQAGILVLLR